MQTNNPRQKFPPQAKVLFLTDETRPYYRYPLSEIIRAFKSLLARRINVIRNTPGLPVWKRNYYEHIIRDEGELSRIRRNITENPLNWVGDHDNPAKE